MRPRTRGDFELDPALTLLSNYLVTTYVFKITFGKLYVAHHLFDIKNSQFAGFFANGGGS